MSERHTHSEGTDELWAKAAGCVKAELGGSVRLRQRLGRRRETRHIWLVEGPHELITVKAVPAAFRAERAPWTASALDLLRRRGSPVPTILWQGPLDDRWWLCVQTMLPGKPLPGLDHSALDQLLNLVELQANSSLGPAGWDLSWWLSVVLFDGWEGWWDATYRAVPETARRLRTFIEPAWAHRLQSTDIVHGGLNTSNVLVNDGVVSGIVDWDDVGSGSRALDLTGLLFDWHRRVIASRGEQAPDGNSQLVRRIVRLAGRNGLRCTVTYYAIARLGLAAQRAEYDKLQAGRKVVDAILDSLDDPNLWRSEET